MWNRTLSPLTSSARSLKPRVSDWSNSDCGYRPSDEPDQEEGEEDDAFDDRWEQWRESREIIEPEPPVFKTPAQRLEAGRTAHVRRQIQAELASGVRSGKWQLDPLDLNPLVNLRKEFGRVQIIVKLANIHLTPEKPTYEGGSWHVEGQANESM